MGTEITFRRGSNFPTSGSGITLSEPVFETTLHTFHIGLGHGVTAEWVGAPISGLSADIAAGITYKTPTASAVKNYIAGLCFGNTGAATITEYVSSFNGLTGAVGGVCAAQANTFTALQSFASGISASGITVDGAIEINRRPYFYLGSDENVVNGVSALLLQGATLGYASRISVNGYSYLGNTGSVDLIPYNGIVYVRRGEYGDRDFPAAASWTSSIYIEENQVFVGRYYGIITVPGSLTANRTVTIPNASGTIALTSQLMGAINGSTAATTAVTSFNGLTGAVTGASLGANTFTGLNSFNAGISASGGTFYGYTRFIGGLSAAGITCPSIVSKGAALTLLGSTSGGLASGSQIILPADSGIQLNGYGGAVSISGYGLQTYISTLKLNTSDDFNEIYGSVTLTPITYLNSDTTLYLPDASGTLALTSQLMGAVNGSTAATTAVTSFNGRTGAVTGASLGANTFTGLNSFVSGISSSYIQTADVYLDSNYLLRIGDALTTNNGTSIIIDDVTPFLYLNSPYGEVVLGDGNGVDSGKYMSITPASNTMYANTELINYPFSKVEAASVYSSTTNLALFNMGII